MSFESYVLGPQLKPHGMAYYIIAIYILSATVILSFLFFSFLPSRYRRPFLILKCTFFRAGIKLVGQSNLLQMVLLQSYPVEV